MAEQFVEQTDFIEGDDLPGKPVRSLAGEIVQLEDMEGGDGVKGETLAEIVTVVAATVPNNEYFRRQAQPRVNRRTYTTKSFGQDMVKRLSKCSTCLRACTVCGFRNPLATTARHRDGNLFRFLVTC